MLITPEQLNADETCIVFDCRYSLLDRDAGRRAWEAGHIPGALYADLEQDLSSPAGSGGRHPLPDRDALVGQLREWGVNRDSTVVCYDQNNSAMACRLWWLLRWLGHADVHVLDGGLDAWQAAGYSTTRAPVAARPGDFSAHSPLTRTLSVAEVLTSSAKLLDAREAHRFRGESEPIDAVAGHIPGAMSVPFMDNLIESRFLHPKELAARFRELGLGTDDDIVCYCGSGVTATHNILALLLAGYEEPALYPGSWSEWITDPNRPIATEYEPGG
jgi:thiosulfate/3-mercaptopyruvate sulfurtransferase